MSAGLLVVAGLVGTMVFGIIVLLMLTHTIEAKAKADATAQAEAKDARVQKDYADIATRGGDPDSTAGVLDDGRFFVPPTQDLQRGRAEGGGGGDPSGA